MLLEIKEQIEKILALVFENYKSLDESSPSGMMAVFGSASGFVASALTRSVKLYALLHDVLSSEAQLKLCRYLQVTEAKVFAVCHFFIFLVNCKFQVDWYRLLQRKDQNLC